MDLAVTLDGYIVSLHTYYFFLFLFMETNKEINGFDFSKHLQMQSQKNKGLPYVIANKENFEKAGRALPFKNYFYTIGLFYEGEGLIRVGEKEYTITNGSLLTIGPGVICQWKSQSYHRMTLCCSMRKFF